MKKPDYTFDSVTKDPGAGRAVELELFNKCANFWRPNEQYANGDFIRPNIATGFAYQATTGTSGIREPRWPTTLAGTVTDGSVTWTCAAAGTNGLSAISSPSAVSSPLGMTIASVSVSETTKILATYTGGTVDQDFDAVFTFTLAGVTRVARQTVRVRYT